MNNKTNITTNNKTIINISRLLVINFMLVALLLVSIATNFVIFTKLYDSAFYKVEDTLNNVSQLLEIADSISKQSEELVTKTDKLSEKIDITRKDNNGGLLLMCLVATSPFLIQTIIWAINNLSN